MNNFDTQERVHIELAARAGLDLQAIKNKYERFFNAVYESVDAFLDGYVRSASHMCVAHHWHEDGHTYLEMSGDMTTEVVIVLGTHGEDEIRRISDVQRELLSETYRAHEMRVAEPQPQAEPVEGDLRAAPRFTVPGYIPPGDLSGYAKTLRQHQELSKLMRR